MSHILETVLPTFTIILIGYIIGRLTKIHITSIVDAALYLGSPALAFVSLLDQKIQMIDAAKIWGALFIITLGGLFIAWLVFLALKQKHTGLYTSIMLMNTVNIPMPIMYLTYGTAGIAAVTLFSLPTNLIIYIIALYLMAGQDWKGTIVEVLKQPMIYGSVLGLVVNLLDIKLSPLIVSPLELIGGMAIPLVLLVLGYNLSQIKITSLRTTLLASFLRMGVGLALGVLAVNLLNIQGVPRSVVIFESAMPAAALASLLATKFNSEAEAVSSHVFLTTLISLAIIPFLLNMID